MSALAYHVLLEGRRMGPYDRRTIIGLRIKKTLAPEHVLEASDGSRITVAELIASESASPAFNPMRSGSYASSRVTCSASLIDKERGPLKIPAFRGEVEIRLHLDVLRIAGKHRSGLGMKDTRIKLPLKDIAYARRTGSRIDFWLRDGEGVGDAALQRIALDVFSDETARELLAALPYVQAWPEPAPD
jgi:hypothetical protein